MNFESFLCPSKDTLFYIYVYFLSKPTPIPTGSSLVEIEYMDKGHI